MLFFFMFMCMWYAHRYVYMHVHMCMGTCVWIREHICGGLTLMVSVSFSHPPLYLSRQDLSNPDPPILVSTASQLTPGDHLSASQVLGLQKATVPACLLWSGL